MRCLLLAIAVVLAAAAPAAAFRDYTIPADGMLPTLGAGDLITVALYGLDYGAMAEGATGEGVASPDPAFGPHQGDVATFVASDRKDYVKRIIGLPGDSVQMKGGVVWLNGAPLPTVPVKPVDGVCAPDDPCAFFRETLPNGVSYLVISLAENGPGDETEVFRVPAGHYFVLGDNRDNSMDSRFNIGAIGYVPAGALVGKLRYILSSPRPGPVEERVAGFPHQP